MTHATSHRQGSVARCVEQSCSQPKTMKTTGRYQTAWGAQSPDLRVKFSTYHEPAERVAIVLEELDGKAQWAVASVNLPDAPIGTNQVAIKDYSENEGIADFLVTLGILEPDVDFSVNSGFVSIPVYNLSEAAIDQILPPAGTTKHC